MKRATELALDEFLKELSASATQGDGMTTAEMAEQLGWSVHRVIEHIIKPAIKQRRLVVGRKTVPTICGSFRPVASYKITRRK